MNARILATWFVLGLFVTPGCATVRAAPTAGFRIDCDVPDATVWVDDVLVGRVSDWTPAGRVIRAGFHRVEIRHPNHYSHFAEINAGQGPGTVLHARLHPLLD